MPSDGDRPDDRKPDEALDPLAQPPLTRPPPRPLTGSRPAPDSEDSEASEEPEDSTLQEAAETSAASEASDETAEPAAAPPPPPKPRGRFLGFLGLLFGLAGLGVAGYLYYTLIYLAPEAALADRIAAVESELATSERSLRTLADAQAEALADFAAEQRRAREAGQQEVLEAVNRVSNAAPPSRREWKVAELAYLLRIANHRVLMERDVSGALVLLKAADAILQGLDDFALYQVRAQLADEILALESVESNDVQGLFLRLEAIKTEISAQSVKLPRFEKEAVEASQPGFWSALWNQIGGYMRFRRFEGASVRPLLAPEEEAYLELNLRLMLERAQLAALRREQVIYEQSLQTAADWIAEYLDPESPGVMRALEELGLLSNVVLDRPLPDVSGSLSALKALGEA